MIRLASRTDIPKIETIFKERFTSDKEYLNMVFTYLGVFVKEEHFQKYLPEYKNLEELKEHYKKGGLGDVKIKQFLFCIMEEFLKPIREKRKYFEKRIPDVIKILKQGTEIANQVANSTLNEVKMVIGIMIAL